MSSPKERKKSLDLERDLALTREDFRVMGVPPPHDPRDLAGYLDFLDELWGSEKKEIEKRFYSEQFRL